MAIFLPCFQARNWATSVPDGRLPCSRSPAIRRRAPFHSLIFARSSPRRYAAEPGELRQRLRPLGDIGELVGELGSDPGGLRGPVGDVRRTRHRPDRRGGTGRQQREDRRGGGGDHQRLDDLHEEFAHGLLGHGAGRGGHLQQLGDGVHVVGLTEQGLLEVRHGLVEPLGGVALPRVLHGLALRHQVLDHTAQIARRAPPLLGGLLQQLAVAGDPVEPVVGAALLQDALDDLVEGRGERIAPVQGVVDPVERARRGLSRPHQAPPPKLLAVSSSLAS